MTRLPVIGKYKITILCTAPAMICAHMLRGGQIPAARGLSWPWLVPEQRLPAETSAAGAGPGSTTPPIASARANSRSRSTARTRAVDYPVIYCRAGREPPSRFHFRHMPDHRPWPRKELRPESRPPASWIQVIVMTTIQDPRPQHRPGAGQRSMDALRTALRALRNVHDEQMRMWEAFRRVDTWDTRPEAPVREPGPAQAGPDASPAAGGGARAA